MCLTGRQLRGLRLPIGQVHVETTTCSVHRLLGVKYNEGCENFYFTPARLVRESQEAIQNAQLMGAGGAG